MPRRPLFCETCTTLLNLLMEVTQEVVTTDSTAGGTSGTYPSPPGLRNRYFEITERLRHHLDDEHRCGRGSSGGIENSAHRWR